MAVAIFLFGMALLFGGLWRARLKVLAAIAVGVAALFITLSFTHGWLETYCQEESNYFCIRVRERLIDGHRVRTLALDQLLHSYVSLDDPTFLVYGYEQVTADFSPSNTPVASI